jgi:uncharacterized C2H2 Zn-finger protein
MMDKQGGQDGMICGKCGATFETQEELDRHVQETHPDEEEQKAT